MVGAGAAGLYAALVAAGEGARVALVSRSPLAQTASYWAQGGVAAALAAGDSPELHLEDTIAAGRRAVRESAARVLCEESPGEVRALERLGVRFDADRHGALALGLEGGHSRRRVVHAGGASTGRRITRDLSALAATHERIEVLEPAAAEALWTEEDRCHGLLARQRGGGPRPLLARATVLATGGMAALWVRTTNPPGAIGAGLSLAGDAGAQLADLELMQFHPTALAAAGRRRRLPDHRGGARRGRHSAERRGASASSTSWHRATRWRWPSTRSSARAAARPWTSTCARSTSPASPASSPA